MKHRLSPEQFAEAVCNGALIGLDPGTKTIGVAVCDERHSLASPLGTVRRTKLTRDLEALRSIITERAASGIVVGLPLHMNGDAGRRAQSVRAFVRNLEDAFGLPVLYWDERLSSFTAEESMKEAGIGYSKRADIIDSAAAAVILQGAIDRLSEIAQSA